MSVDETKHNEHEHELAGEQRFVDRAYALLDELKRRYRDHQRRAHASVLRTTPQALTERDALAAHWGDESQRLENVGDQLVFGRIDMRDHSHHYIGRVGLRSDDGDQLLLDWRAPASQPFYQATGAHPHGVIRRRHIQTRARRVIGIEDEVLDANNATDELSFQGEGALMAALGAARDGRMSDIVATIQAEQDAIIRRPSTGLLLIQGGPGTGKTAVALHRAAYLLYAERARLESSGVLIIGPSRVFLSYIDRVLPSLGESGVVATTIADLVPGYRGVAHESEAVAQIKGRIDWVEICREAVRSYERIPDDTALRVAGYEVVLRREDVKRARTNARRSRAPHNEAWEGFALELMNALARQMDAQASSGEDLSWYHSYIRSSREARRAINGAWLPVSPLAVLEKLWANPQFLAQCAPMLSNEERDLLARERGAALTVSDIPILDELEELLGPLPTASTEVARRERERERAVASAGDAMTAMELGGGIVSAQILAERSQAPDGPRDVAYHAARDRQWAYGHVIVDEAQELSPMAWHAIVRRCPARSFTVTGDLDQRSSSQRVDAWRPLLGPAAPYIDSEAVLTVSYRTPATILDRACAVMEELEDPVVFPVRAARDRDDAYAVSLGVAVDSPSIAAIVAQEEQWLDTHVGQGMGRIAVIADASSPVFRDAASSSLDDRIITLTPVQSKGLEFDTVILVDPDRIAASNPGDIYVAMTRPTQRLHIIAEDLHLDALRTQHP